MNFSDSITVHPDVQDGAPVFSGTRIRIETLVDYMRIGVTVNEFLAEFPSVTRDQVSDVLDMMHHSYSFDALQQQAAA